ncbi:hypothetical protein SAY86_022017 [Trapa natans]|uniref:Phytocyanin domain-containing protein n=1 Tax=Trapa natans TaxID=22666 RepID=A0AAN7RG13_TRANT|nr:hypothetical protein SAY86_022017 [Trapa natans]
MAVPAIFLQNLATAALFVLLIATATAYSNYTVGGDSGWFFNVTTNTSSANFSSWAASNTFSLGDFLIFNTNTNQTVVLTYNLTTYKACNTDDASDADTFHYDSGNSVFAKKISIPVPLTNEGLNYFFSDIDGGVQCLNGMQFAIDVKYGAGLPPSLNQPPPPPYVSPPGLGSAQSPPVSGPSSNRAFSTSASVQFFACALTVLAAVSIFIF